MLMFEVDDLLQKKQCVFRASSHILGFYSSYQFHKREISPLVPFT